MKSASRALVSAILFLFIQERTRAGGAEAAATASNQFGIDLYRQLAKGDGNLCLSPYSIETALAMTFAGAEGVTRAEMATVLHFQKEGDAIHDSFSALNQSLGQIVEPVSGSPVPNEPKRPITLAVANRLFAQKGYEFRPSFLSLVEAKYRAPLETLDFRRDAATATSQINQWVADRTRNRIRDLIPFGALDAATRIVLVNALYFRARWADEFAMEATRPEPFHVKGGAASPVPTMRNRSHHFGYLKTTDFTAVSLPYRGGEFQFLILLPAAEAGFGRLEEKLSVNLLADCAKIRPAFVDLQLPRFKFEPPTIPLASELRGLGLKTAFDQPPGSANFDRMAPRKPQDYLFISEVFHKTFIAVDEKGTEAAAATAVAMPAGAVMEKPSEPIAVKVDRPFLYAIQQVATGACLFLGRVVDPR